MHTAIDTGRGAVVWAGTALEPIPSAATSGVEEIAGWWSGGQPMVLKTDGTVVSWTGTTGSLLSMPSFAASNVAHIVGYGNYGAAVKQDGSVVTWSSNTATSSNPVPASVADGVAAIATVSGNFVAVKPY
jgi:hypothetical protein